MNSNGCQKCERVIECEMILLFGDGLHSTINVNGIIKVVIYFCLLTTIDLQANYIRINNYMQFSCYTIYSSIKMVFRPFLLSLSIKRNAF